jgi:prevent-host-death family protein
MCDFEGGFIMLVTATEFKCKIGKYLALAAQEDIFITKNGKNVAKLTSTKQDKAAIMESLFGIVPQGDLCDTDVKRFKAERLARKYESLD